MLILQKTSKASLKRQTNPDDGVAVGIIGPVTIARGKGAAGRIPSHVSVQVSDPEAIAGDSGISGVGGRQDGAAVGVFHHDVNLVDTGIVNLNVLHTGLVGVVLVAGPGVLIEQARNGQHSTVGGSVVLRDLGKHLSTVDVVVLHQIIDQKHPVTGGEVAIDVNVQDNRRLVIPNSGEGGVASHSVYGVCIVDGAVGIPPARKDLTAGSGNGQVAHRRIEVDRLGGGGHWI